MEEERSFRFRWSDAPSDLDPPALPAGRLIRRPRRHRSAASLATCPSCGACGARMYRVIKLNSARDRAARAAAGLAPVRLLSYRLKCSVCPVEFAVKRTIGDLSWAQSPDGGGRAAVGEPGAPCDDVAASLAGLRIGGADDPGVDDADMMVS